jgi:hypothetical protein
MVAAVYIVCVPIILFGIGAGIVVWVLDRARNAEDERATNAYYSNKPWPPADGWSLARSGPGLLKRCDSLIKASRDETPVLAEAVSE